MNHRPLLVRLLPLAALAAILIAELGLWATRHHTLEELAVLADEGTAAERVWAWHVIANRDDPRETRRWPATVIQRLVDDPEPLVADFSFTIDICRLRKPIYQERRVTHRLKEDALRPPPESLEDWWRWYVFYRRKVGGFPVGSALRIKVRELRWLLEVLDGGTLDAEQVLPHVRRLQAEVNVGRLKSLAPSRRREQREKREKRAADQPSSSANGHGKR